jgi:hypothetical protein
MVPLHDSDVAENRWKEGEWRTFELWERIELRLRRRKFWTIAATALAFLGLLSIPIVRDRAPKWRATSAMRRLAVKANQMKVDAAALGVPLRLRLRSTDEGLEYIVEKVGSCAGAVANPLSGQEWNRGPLFSSAELGNEYSVLTEDDARSLGLERVVNAVCYEPLPSAISKDEPGMPDPSRVQAIGILTAKDLAEKRLDRIAFLNFSGVSAEIDFD